MTTFALVHGGGHGGWCWESLVPELQARGHRAVAADLPAEDPGAGARQYAQVVVDALAASLAGEDVIVVGHSLGGLTVPVVASLRPVRRMVFLSAYVPLPGLAFADHLATQPEAVLSNLATAADFDAQGLRAPMSWEFCRSYYYTDAPEDLARDAWRRLRAQGSVPLTERCPLSSWPAAPSSAVVMAEDRALNPEWLRRVARDRLGVVAIELPGGHTAFLSHPAPLADALDSLARIQR